MAKSTVSDVDDEVLASLKTHAQANHRSQQGENRDVFAQQALRSTQTEEFRERTARLISLTEGLRQTDSVGLIREDRDR